MPEHVATRNRKIRQEELRAKFQGVQYIKQLEDSAKEYDKIIAEIDKATKVKQRLTAKDKEKRLQVNMTLDALKLKLDVVKAKIDLNLRRLKFVVPELKGVELTDPDGNNPLNPLVSIIQKALAEDK